MRHKMDESGITDGAAAAGSYVVDGAKTAGGYVVDGAKTAGGLVVAASAAGLTAVNERIEQNETLAGIKRQATDGASQAASYASEGARRASTYVSGLLGWGASAQAQQQAPEEGKVDGEATGN